MNDMSDRSVGKQIAVIIIAIGIATSMILLAVAALVFVVQLTSGRRVDDAETALSGPS